MKSSNYLRSYLYPFLFLCVLVVIQIPILVYVFDKNKNRNMEYEYLRASYGELLEDTKYFPIPYNLNDDAKEQFFFENTWMQKRTFGGERGHEGCDVFGRESISGYYPVISISDGRIENIGWLPQGGYRIGIRSPHGGYFYYAHLAQYSKEYKIGDKVMAGEQIGLLGDTGYGEEGTTGKFPPHLHLGIYFNDHEGMEYAVNPYWVLKKLKNSVLKYPY